jgi:hypothetical protein
VVSDPAGMAGFGIDPTPLADAMRAALAESGAPT